MTRPGPVTPDSGDELVRDIREELTATIEVALVGRGVPMDVVGAVHQFVDHLMAAVDENARAEERDRIADAIDAEGDQYADDLRGRTWGPVESARNRGVVAGFQAAARIARGETP